MATKKRKSTKSKAKPAAKRGGGNLDKLVNAGVLDPANLSAKHKGLIEKKLTAAEVKALIKAKKLLSPGGEGPWQPDADGASF
jgi:hypothetical protein